jgi:hypothetical protein
VSGSGLKQVVQTNDLYLREKSFKVSRVERKDVTTALRLHGGDKIPDCCLVALFFFSQSSRMNTG